MKQNILVTQFGSHVYGTNTPQSDLDYKAIYMPTAWDIVLGKVQQTIVNNTKTTDGKNSPNDIDHEAYALQQYMKLLLEGQTVALDILFTPKQWHTEYTPLWTEIKALKSHWLHRNILPFIGYCRRQANKYGIKGSRVAAVRLAVNLFETYKHLHGDRLKLREFWEDIETTFKDQEHCAFVDEMFDGHDKPVRMLSVCDRKVQEHITVKEAHNIYKKVLDNYGSRALEAESNENVDWKAMTHATRICYQAKELLLDHTVTFPRPERELLLAIRTGQKPYKEVAEIIEQGMAELEVIQAGSTLPEKPNYALAESLIFSEYKHTIALVDKHRDSYNAFN